jgi:hypothetical protein
MLMLFILFHDGLKSCLINLHGVVFWQNWFMNAALSHEMSQANYLKYDASIVAKCDPWQKNRSLVVDMCSLSKSPHLTQKNSRNASKSLNRGD